MESKKQESSRSMSKVQKLSLESTTQNSEWQKEIAKRLKEIWNRKYGPIRKVIEEIINEH